MKKQKQFTKQNNNINKHKHKKNKRKLTFKRILKRIIGTVIIAIIYVPLLILDGIIYLYKFIKKNYEHLLHILVLLSMIVGIALAHIQLSDIDYKYYKQNTQLQLNEINSILVSYNDEIVKYKEQIDNKVQEIAEEEKIKEEKVTNRSNTNREISNTIPKNELQEYAHDLCINQYGWTEEDFTCLVKLWERESNWNPNAHNKSSGAHGIPQSLPASKMASEGDDYYTNGKTQIRWGLSYIKDRYYNPSYAWQHSEKYNWY